MSSGDSFLFFNLFISISILKLVLSLQLLPTYTEVISYLIIILSG
nr:MAG TPA: hypothetical protein [Bacteriophage sp.]